MNLSIRTKTSVAVAGALLATVMAPLVASPSAYALGNNRNVHRSCGTNYVASGADYVNSKVRYYWAQTTKTSGDCSGRLSVAFQYFDGYRSPREYGSTSAAYTSMDGMVHLVQYGLHWGCDTCNVTYS